MSLFAIFFFTAKEGWSIFYLPFKLVTELMGYYLITHVALGGSVNYYFIPHKANEDEKNLDRLIIKHSNKALVKLTAIVFIATDIVLSVTHSNQNNNFHITDIAFFMMWAIVIVVLMCEGVKYMTAWWNIKRNWKKEFGS